MMTQKLFEPFNLGGIELQNRIAMASMSRCRAENPGLVPTPMMAEYYRKRAAAGLILTEGTWVSKEAIGFINVPGLFTEEQVAGWRLVTRAVHSAGGKIFSQIAHLGGVSHPDHQGGALPLAPSAVNPREMAFTPNGFQETVVPREMTVADIRRTIGDFRRASESAKAAGFDGVEIHGAYLYLIPEFLNSATNIRTDAYGGSPENRSRFVLELLDAVIGVWGPNRVGLKLSPGLVSGLVSANEDTEATYRYLLTKLNDYPLAYVHAWGMPAAAGTLAARFNDVAGYFRSLYRGIIVVSGGFTRETAEAGLARGDADIVAFGTPFVANPDLVTRLRKGFPLSEPNRDLFYGGGPSGYIDYLEYAEKAALV